MPTTPSLPQPSAYTYTPSAFEVWVEKGYTLLLDWLLVRGRCAPKQTLSYEAALATHWLIRAGVLTVLAGASFLVRYLILHSVLGPLGRVLLLTAAGLTLIGVGLRLLRGHYRLLGEGGASVGTVLLYFTLYAATMRFALLPLGVGFAAMGVLTLGAGAMALGLRLPSVATVVTAGGLLTPVLLPSPNPNLALLYLYLGGLTALVAAGALWRKWEPLACLAFLISWAITFAAGKHALSLPWTLALHLLFLLTFFAHLIRRHWQTPALTLAVLPAAEIFFWIARHAFGGGDGANFTCALLLAATYATLSALLRARGERRLLWASALLALVLAVCAPAFLLGAGAQGGVLALLRALVIAATVELGWRLREPILSCLGRGAAILLLGWFACMAFFDFFITYAPGCGPSLTGSLLILLASVLLSAHGLWRLRCRGVAIAGGIATWLALTRSAALLFQGADASLVAVSCAWGLYALGLIFLGLRLHCRACRLCALALLALTLGKVFLIDLAELPLLFKILAALPLGLLLMGGAGLYLRLAPREERAARD